MGQGGFEAAAEQLAVAHKENRSGARVIGQDPVPEASADLCATRLVQDTMVNIALSYNQRAHRVVKEQQNAGPGWSLLPRVKGGQGT